MRNAHKSGSQIKAKAWEIGDARKCAYRLSIALGPDRKHWGGPFEGDILHRRGIPACQQIAVRKMAPVQFLHQDGAVIGELHDAKAVEAVVGHAILIAPIEQ